MGVLQPIDAADADGEAARVQPEPDGAAKLEVATIGKIVREGTPLARWPESLAEMYRAEERAGIYREYRFLFILGFAACMATISLDMLANPSMVAEGVALRLIIALPPLMLGLYAGARRWTGLLKFILTAWPIAFIAVVVHLAMHLPGDHAARYLMGASLLMGIACLTTPIGIAARAAFNAGAVCVTAGVIALSGFDKLGTHVIDLVMMSMIAIATVALAARIERLRQRSFLLGLRGTAMRRELVAANTALRDLSDTDSLTRVRNRRWFERKFAEQIEDPEQQSGSGEWVGLMMIDLDHFKPFNDHHGHQAGDSCLKMVAGSLREVFEREDAMFARYGGEEFIAALCSDDPDAIAALAEKARIAVASRLAPIEGGGRALITASIGVALAPAHIRLMREELIEMADAALYSGKNSGRNRVEVVEAGPPLDGPIKMQSFG